MITKKIIAAGILPLCPKTGRILLVLRGRNQPSPLTWACWGGKFEDGVDITPKDCAKREFKEESMCGELYSISKKELYMTNSNHLQFWTYLAVFRNEFIPNIEIEKEAESWGWFHVNNLPEPLLDGFKEMLDSRGEDLKKIIAKLK